MGQGLHQEKPTPPKPVTYAEFMRSASWIANHAANWAGELACEVVSETNKSTKLVRPEALERFRADILAHLDTATGHTD